jgi:hypothetical protein
MSLVSLQEEKTKIRYIYNEMSGTGCALLEKRGYFGIRLDLPPMGGIESKIILTTQER